MISKRHLLAAIAGAALASNAWAQVSYPGSKPVKMVVTFPAGSESDIVTRMIASKLQTRGYTIVVENKPGAGGNLGSAQALREPPDGYTLLVISGAYAGNAVVLKPEYDPVAAIQPVVRFTVQQSVLLIAPASPYKTLAELIEHARKAPGSVNYGSSGIGSLANLTTEYFASLAGVKLNHVPYNQSGNLTTDLVGGRIDMRFAGMGSSLALAKAGKVRILAVTGQKRMPELPDVPTFAEAGLPSFDGDLWHGLVVAKDVPKPIVDKLNADVNAVLRDPEVAAHFQAHLLRPAGGSPEQFRSVIRNDMERWQKVVKAANIKVE